MLQYDSKPNYALLHAKITEYRREKKIEDEDPFDWEEGGIHFEYATRKAAKAPREEADEQPRLAGEPSWLSEEEDELETTGNRETNETESDLLD